ncbi:MAG: hypothetical protein LBI13_04015 [Streptococcaceae bacterium]|jgi:hypothetical protein|nr:hypothetical protein [Streptococcaceae bacterium]
METEVLLAKMIVTADEKANYYHYSVLSQNEIEQIFKPAIESLYEYDDDNEVTLLKEPETKKLLESLKEKLIKKSEIQNLEAEKRLRSTEIAYRTVVPVAELILKGLEDE